MKSKVIKGIPFILHATVHTKKEAKIIAERLRFRGYYVRLSGSSKGIEIWVSLNPRWFYRL